MQPAIAHYGRSCKTLTIALSIAVLLLAIAVFWTESLLDTVMLLTLFAPLLCLLALEFWFVRIELTETAIRCYSPFRASREIPISDVTHVDFAALPQWFRIHTRDHGIVRLHGYLTGLYDVLQRLETTGHTFPRVRHVRSPFDSI